jgi:hypothetical protein
MSKINFSLFLTTILIVGFFSVALSKDANAQGPPCTLEIEKVAIPADNTPFDFVVTGDIDAMQTLSDPGNPIYIGGLNVGQTVTVTEELPPGWELQSIECEQGETNCGDTQCLHITINEETNSITAQCFDDDEGRCTFTNTFSPSQVPTLSEWGLIVMAGLLAVIGFVVIRRKKLLIKS